MSVAQPVQHGLLCAGPPPGRQASLGCKTPTTGLPELRCAHLIQRANGPIHRSPWQLRRGLLRPSISRRTGHAGCATRTARPALRGPASRKQVSRPYLSAGRLVAELLQPAYRISGVRTSFKGPKARYIGAHGNAMGSIRARSERAEGPIHTGSMRSGTTSVPHIAFVEFDPVLGKEGSILFLKTCDMMVLFLVVDIR